MYGLRFKKYSLKMKRYKQILLYVVNTMSSIYNWCDRWHVKCVIKKLIVSVQNFWYAPCTTDMQYTAWHVLYYIIIHAVCVVQCRGVQPHICPFLPIPKSWFRCVLGKNVQKWGKSIWKDREKIFVLASCWYFIIIIFGILIIKHDFSCNILHDLVMTLSS